MKRSTKYLIKQTLYISAWIAFSCWWTWAGLKAEMVWLAWMHAFLIWLWVWTYCISKHSSIAVWKLMKYNENMSNRSEILA